MTASKDGEAVISASREIDLQTGLRRGLLCPPGITWQPDACTNRSAGHGLRFRRICGVRRPAGFKQSDCGDGGVLLDEPRRRLLSALEGTRSIVPRSMRDTHDRLRAAKRNIVLRALVDLGDASGGDGGAIVGSRLVVGNLGFQLRAWACR